MQKRYMSINIVIILNFVYMLMIFIYELLLKMNEGVIRTLEVHNDGNSESKEVPSRKLIVYKSFIY